LEKESRICKRPIKEIQRRDQDKTDDSTLLEMDAEIQHQRLSSLTPSDIRYNQTHEPFEEQGHPKIRQ
jgi:hypothetical protein